MAPFKLAVVVGSARRESINLKLGQALARLGAGVFAATYPRIDDLPIYNQDLEAELPQSVKRFKAEIAAADAVLFVTPEHNRSIPALLKNAIDWAGRPYGQSVWKGKVAAITGTSPGAIATAVGQQHLRQILSVLGVEVMAGEAYITFKPGLVADDSAIADESTRAFLKAYIDQFASWVRRLAPPAQRRAA